MQGKAILRGGHWDGLILPRRGEVELRLRLTVERPDQAEAAMPGIDYVRTEEYEGDLRVYRYAPS